MKRAQAPIISCLTLAALLLSTCAGMTFTVSTSAQTANASRSERDLAQHVRPERTLFCDGVVVGGVVLGHGVIFGDGIIIGDGIMVDGIIVGDAAVTASANRAMIYGDPGPAMRP